MYTPLTYLWSCILISIYAIVQKINLYLLDYFVLKRINFLLNLSSEFYVTCAYIFILLFALEISYFCAVQVSLWILSLFKILCIWYWFNPIYYLLVEKELEVNKRLDVCSEMKVSHYH